MCALDAVWRPDVILQRRCSVEVVLLHSRVSNPVRVSRYLECMHSHLGWE